MAAHHDADALERGYAATHRTYELCGMLLTATTAIWLLARLVAAPALSGWWTLPAALLGLLGADLVSGIVHWGFDTWGDLDTPIVGRLAIRAFRQHHVDPTVMLRHDFVETNGHNITLALTLTAGGLAVVPAHGATPGALFAGLAMLWMAVFVSLTSQIHKWAHMPSPPRLVRCLQDARVLLSPAHHLRHHAAPHVRNYCITVGWMNPILDGLGFFPRLERLIAAATGKLPRRDHG